jgi:hypothetical protein
MLCCLLLGPVEVGTRRPRMELGAILSGILNARSLQTIDVRISW